MAGDEGFEPSYRLPDLDSESSAIGLSANPQQIKSPSTIASGGARRYSMMRKLARVLHVG